MATLAISAVIIQAVFITIIYLNLYKVANNVVLKQKKQEERMVARTLTWVAPSIINTYCSIGIQVWQAQNGSMVPCGLSLNSPARGIIMDELKRFSLEG